MQELITNFVVGYLAAHLTEFAKKNPNIPFINEQATLVVRLVVALMAIAVQVLTIGLEPGGFTAVDWNVIVKSALDAIMTFAMAEFTYHQKLKPTPVVQAAE